MAFGDADRVIVFFEGVNGAKCTAGIVGSVIVQDGRVSDQQIQSAVPVVTKNTKQLICISSDVSSFGQTRVLTLIWLLLPPALAR